MIKKNKNGFTLIELLTVIIILGALSLIFVPNAMKVFRDNGLKIYKIKEKELIKAAEDYVNYDTSFVAPTTGNAKYVMMTDLVSGNYMNKILDSSTGNECKAFVKITLNDIRGYNYEVCLLCDEYSSSNSFCSLNNYNDL